MPTGYIDLGARGPITGTEDTTGQNSGNWTIAFTPAILSCTLAQFEIYKMVVHGAANSTVRVYRENKDWDVCVYGTNNSWDPSQALILKNGESLYLMYSDPVTDGTPPNATIWMRYDSTLAINKETGG